MSRFMGPGGSPHAAGNMSNINNYDPSRRKPKQPMGKTMKRLWKYLGKHRRLILLAIVLTALSQACNLICPKLSGMAINAIGLGTGEADFPAF